MAQAHLVGIGTAVPPNKIDQRAAAAWMAETLQVSPGEGRLLRGVYEASGIETRYSVLPDFNREAEAFDFFPDTAGGPFPDVDSRMAVYRAAAPPLAEAAVRAAFADNATLRLENTTHLIVVSCTGMYAPGLDIELVAALGLPGTVERTHIGFMGCYAALNGLKAADYICRAEPGAQALVVAVELCTIHLQRDKSRDGVVSNALFSDGAACAVIRPEARTDGKPGLSLERFACALAPEGAKDMAWHISTTGFRMTLSSYVPQAIGGGVRKLAEELLAKLKLSLSDVAHYAIHPGGRRILEVCEAELGLSPEDNCRSYETLRDFGNMSSATVLFVLRNLLATLLPGQRGERVLSFAFGPGLTLEGMVLGVE